MNHGDEAVRPLAAHDVTPTASVVFTQGHGGFRMRKWILMVVLVFLASTAQADVYSVGQPCQTCQTCSNGKCGPIQTAAHSVVQYGASVGNAVVQPFRGGCGLFNGRIIEAIQNRPRLFGRLRGGCCGQ